MRAGVRMDVGRVIMDETLHRLEGCRRRIREPIGMEKVKATSSLPVPVPESAEPLLVSCSSNLHTGLPLLHQLH